MKNVSTSTVRRLCEASLYGRNAVKKPLLRKQNNVKSLQWAKAHKDWTIEQWNKFLWTDKSKFELVRSNKRVYIWQRIGERAANPCITPTVNHGGTSVMVWGVANCKVKDLHKLKGKLNQIRYHCILQHPVILSGMQLVVQGFVLIKDNNPKHMSKLCQRYIKRKEEQHVLQLMSWPGKSSDLNTIEQVWDDLDWKVRAK